MWMRSPMPRAERTAAVPEGVRLQKVLATPGVVSTMADERGRAALADYLGSVSERVYHVGRLDADSEGLLLLTNDGDLAHRLMHPSFGIEKEYVVEVEGSPSRGALRRL